MYTFGDGWKRTAIVINNDQLDATLITQLSNEDCVAEVRSEAVKFYSVSMYCDSHRDIEEAIRQLEKVMAYTKGNGLLTAMDSNARSKVWHDTITYPCGKILEEFLICNDLYVLNEATATPTFQSKRGSSHIDLTITNSRLVRYVSDWICGQEESCSDHNILNFKIVSVNNGEGKMNYMGVCYITNQEDYKKSDTNLATNFISTFNCINKMDANKLQEEKFKFWQKYCSSTEESNPWKTIYKIVSGKLRGTTCLTTLQQPVGTFTLDAECTTKHMLDYFVPKDETNDSAVPKQIRKLIKEPTDTEDDKSFS